MNRIQTNIRHLRRGKNWTQEELAKRVHVTRSLVGAWEEGRSEPKIDDQLALCKAFDCRSTNW